MRGDYYSISGGEPLYGRTVLHGAKNAVLPLLAAAMLSGEKVCVKDCPYITDVDNMTLLLKALNLDVERAGRDICVSGRPEQGEVPEAISRVMRSSMFMLGALLSVNGEVTMPLPGGCRIGARPLDIHLSGLEKLGASVDCTSEQIKCSAKKLCGAEILMKYPSVGATENLLMAAVTARGETTLINCAREPEIVSLAEGLRSMGAKICGEGTSVIKISGVEGLGGASVVPVSDRIICGTLLAAVALTGGKIEIAGADDKTLGCVAGHIENDHCLISRDCGSVIVESDGIVSSGDVTTAPYPLFPTDMQAPIMALKCYAKGVSNITETVFENRFAAAKELTKMGAKIYRSGNTATVCGDGKKLRGATLEAQDLRGGAGLVIAALGAEGQSFVTNIEYIDRGYENFEAQLSELGAHIIRKNSENTL